jgi:hypothetical protein
VQQQEHGRVRGPRLTVEDVHVAGVHGPERDAWGAGGVLTGESRHFTAAGSIHRTSQW